MKKRVAVFTLPGEERLVNNLLNDDLVDIVDEERIACPKEAIILYFVKYEDNREECEFD
jgi:hypothetical protein